MLKPSLGIRELPIRLEKLLDAPALALYNTYLVAARGQAGFSASSPSRNRKKATTAASSALMPSISSAR